MSSGRFSVETVFKGVDRISGTMRRIQTRVGAATKGMGKSLKALDGHLGSVHGGLKRIAGATAAIGTVGGLAAFAIGKTGAEFEQAITAVGAVSLKTRDQIADLEAKAKELGATTKFTATEAANAMEIMAKAGFSNADILSGVDGVLNAAAASGLEIAEVADHVSNALKGMGLQTSEAGRVADVLALASSRTNSSIGTLGESLSNVASTARQFKIPLEDTVAGVALLQDVGLDASVAGSAMNTMLTKMAKPTDEIARKMKKFGVAFKDSEGNMLPFQEVIANISKAAEESGGNMDQVAFIADLVGLRGQKAAANLKDLFDTGRVQALTKELYKAEGAAKKMAALRMNNTIGDMTLLGSAIDAVKVALFETESGPLRGVIQSMTKWVGENQTLIVSKFQSWVSWVRDNLPEIVVWLKRIGVSIAVFYSFAAAVKAARLAVLAFNLVTKATTLVVRLFQGAVYAARVAVLAARLAMWAYQGSIVATRVATVGATAAAAASKVAMVASKVATVAVTVAQWAYNAALGAGSAAMVGARVAMAASIPVIGATVAAMAPLLVTVGAVTAAVLALVAAWDQYNKLDKELGDVGVGGTISKMWEMGTLDPFKAYDTAANEKAREVAKKRAAMVTPQERVAPTSTSAEVTIRDETGRAAVTKQPKRGTGFGLQVAHTGAF